MFVIDLVFFNGEEGLKNERQLRFFINKAFIKNILEKKEEKLQIEELSQAFLLRVFSHFSTCMQSKFTTSITGSIHNHTDHMIGHYVISVITVLVRDWVIIIASQFQSKI